MSANTPSATGDGSGKGTELAALRRDVQPMAPDLRVVEAADLMLRPEFAALLCLPVVEHGRPVGTISRHQLNQIFLHRFGRELYGKQPVSAIMNSQPLLVEESTPLEQATQIVASRIGSPITEDFVLTRAGVYLGMGVVVDLLAITQRRLVAGAAQLTQAYRQLKSSQTALVQNEKMASLGQMVAGVAHEINTPLGYVRNNVEMMRGLFMQLDELLAGYEQLGRMLVDEATDEQALSRHMTELAGASAELRDSGMLQDCAALFDDSLYGLDSIKELVVNLRNFSRLDAAKVSEVSINDCLDQTLVIANHLLKNRVEIIKRYGELPRIACSPSQINQVFLNVLNNAAQAIEHERGKLLIKTEHDGAWVRISIQDNGKGIAAEHLQKIFDPFFTTKAVGQGTGLGLSISYKIVQAHGGNIAVASVPGTGSRFVISLPVDSAARSPSAVGVAA